MSEQITINKDAWVELVEHDRNYEILQYFVQKIFSHNCYIDLNEFIKNVSFFKEEYKSLLLDILDLKDSFMSYKLDQIDFNAELYSTIAYQINNIIEGDFIDIEPAGAYSEFCLIDEDYSTEFLEKLNKIDNSHLTKYACYCLEFFKSKATFLTA